MKYVYLLLLFSASFSVSAQKILTGKVTTQDGEALVGASVVVQGTTNGTITDYNGDYSLKVPDGNETLVFSFIGYTTQEVKIGGREEVNVVLAEDIESLSEVVIIGYGEQSSKEVSTAVATVDRKTIESLPVARPEQVLQGTAPGVIVQQNSGSPGSPLTVRLRGVGTAGGSQPLYLVDGLQVPDLNYLNSSDIADISILKDAAASAIYGARGGNGVVLVQTRKGNRDKKPQLAFSGYYGIQNLANKPGLMDRDQYAAYYNEYQQQAGGTPLSQSDITKLPNTDWYDEVFDKNSPMQNYSASISGGGEAFSYYLSGGIFDQVGMVGGEEDKSKFNRKNAKLKFDVDVLDNLNVNVGADIVHTNRDYLFENQAGTGVAIMNYINAIPAIYPAFDPENPSVPFHMGDLNNPIVVNGVTLPAVGAVLNPHVSMLLNNNRTVSDLRVYNIGATWNPFKNVEVRTSYAHYSDESLDKNFYPQYDYRPIQNLFNETADFTQTTYENAYSQWEGNLKYDFINLEDHNLDVLVGFSVLTAEGRIESRSGSDFLVNDFEKINFALIKDATAIINPKPFAYESGLLSFYGRVNYNFKEKYLFSATLRNDASSKFGADNRSGTFPSFSAGWVLSEESFLNTNNFIDLLKLRASWGINGNDNISNYQFSTVVNPNSGPSFGGMNTPGVSAGFLPNPSVKWEEISQTNIGLDLNAFNNTFGLTLDYYVKNTSDMLVPIGTPLYIGLNSAAANVADVKNTGLEVLLTYKKTYQNDFSWNVGFNLGYNKNEVTSLGENGRPLNGGNIGFIFSDPITRTDIGQPIASFYGYEVESIDDNGELIFRDTDGEAGITPNDKTFIGKPFPDYTYGVMLGASYKGFDISGFLYGSQGNDIYDATVRLDASYSNRPTTYVGDNAPGNILGTGGTGGSQTEVSDFYVKDGSFTKLKTLTLGYNLPKGSLEGIGMSNLRIYLTGQNLFTITDYDGVDPEIGQASTESVLDVGIDRGFYPQPRVFMVGFQARF
ncbi:SusC/RagA family TonB-linked outer membrane protein [Fulvivirga ligni]|uniref:SusC/RagA family TonB-linked outer membrane protein n=1 Tax=Fulvivirga ligni TaxID=2904246 RepID=UPI001F2E12AB|nr:TonB-dependent receptor [Fulvivirga ligni]UII23853.1 TonB-dependent receptor [Fulvivirga ligni]